MANQSFEVQAGTICMTATEEFWATEPRGAAGLAALADVSEETLAELRALPLETKADRATMDAFVPLAERWIEFFRQEAAKGKHWSYELYRGYDRLAHSLNGLISGCLIVDLPGTGIHG
jgi:hypothetical protein